MRKIIDTCDRCGKEYSGAGRENRKFDGFQFFNRKRGGLFDYDLKRFLCPECEEELESWYFDEKDQPDKEEEVQVDENIPEDNSYQD